MSEQRDNVMPDGKWEFDKSVTEVFDDMLRRSIPQYDVMRDACFEVGKRYVKSGTDIVDLGCSRGEALAAFIDEFGAHNHYVGIDVSEPMLEASRKRFSGYINTNVVNIKKLDLRNEYPSVNSSLTLSVLTLQFTPLEYRLKILKNIYDNLIKGGAFILVEKVIGDTADIDDMMVDIYYNQKNKKGYTEKQIERKKWSLEGVLVPATQKWNEAMLENTGFSQIDCFWRWINFAAWIAIK